MIPINAPPVFFMRHHNGAVYCFTRQDTVNCGQPYGETMYSGCMLNDPDGCESYYKPSPLSTILQGMKDWDVCGPNTFFILTLEPLRLKS